MAKSAFLFATVRVFPIVAVLLCLCYVSAEDKTESVNYAKVLKDCEQSLLERAEQRRQHPEEAFSRFLQYFDSYFESLGAKYEEQTDLDNIIENARQSRVVLLGDLHDIADCRRNQMKILDRLSGTHRITLGVEFLPLELTDDLDRFMNGNTDIGEFCGKAKTFWNYFDKETLLYADLLEFAKRKKIRVVPLESTELDMQRLLVNGDTAKRDDHASKIINGLKARMGKRDILCVIYGFYHCLGKGHLAEKLVVAEPPLTILPWAPIQHAQFRIGKPNISSFALRISNRVYYLPCSDGEVFKELVDDMQTKEQLQEHSLRTELSRLQDRYRFRFRDQEEGQSNPDLEESRTKPSTATE
jgi:hypothetical protein